MTIDGRSVVVAAEVKKGDQELVLRNADGVPAWGSAGRRHRTAAPTDDGSGAQPESHRGTRATPVDSYEEMKTMRPSRSGWHPDAAL